MRTSRLTVLLFALLISGIVTAAIPAKIRYDNHSLTPSGRIDTRYPDGNDGVAATLNWSTIATQSVFSGGSYSVNLRTGYLTGTAAGTATLALTPGYSLPAGWSLTTDGLSYSGTGTGSALVKIRATYATLTADSNEFQVQAQTAPTGDTIAPTIPTELKATPGTGQVTLTWNASSDPYTTQAGGGVANYDVRLGTSIVQTVTAPSSNIGGALTQNILGSYTPTATSSLSGADYTLTSSGSIDDTSDLVITRSAQVSGDGTAIVKVASHSSTATYDKYGIEVRGVNAADSVRFSCYYMAGGSGYVQAQSRTTSGGSAGTVASTYIGNYPVWLRVKRAGNVWSCDYSLDGIAFTAVASNYPLALPTSSYWGLFAVSTEGSGGATATGVLQGWRLHNAADVSYVHTTSTGGSYSVRAKDVAGNASAYSAAINGTPGTPPSGNAIKFHPGVYIWYIPGAVNGITGYRIDLVTHRNTIINFIDTVCNDSTIQGFQVFTNWRALEGDTAGDYSAGFASVDAILTKLTSCNKRLILAFQSVLFGNTGSQTDIYPAYIVNGASYGITPFHAPQVGSSARTWQQATNDRVIAMLQAYGGRYNSHANFEMMSTGETAIAVDNGQDGYSNDALLTQLQRMYSAARAAWPNTAVRVSANDLWPDSLMQSLLATCLQYQITVGGPDVWPGDITQADRVFLGLDTTGALVSTRYRDQIPWTSEVQWQSFGGQWTLQQLYDAPMIGYTPTSPNGNGSFTMPSMHPAYFIWYANESNGTTATQWGAIQTFIHNTNGEVYPRGALSSVPCPTSYSSCIRN